jgi:casein kinase 1
MDRIIAGQFRLRRRIGAGSFGEIYSGENTRTHHRVAIKLESIRARVPQLSYEAKLYTIFSGGTGIPHIHWYGTEEGHNVMVIDLLGKSLEDLFVACHHRFSVKTVLMLADQMISCVEYIHNKNFIHRDIKPDNFVMGIGDNANQVFVIDFGLSKKYRDPHTHLHIPYMDGKSLTGTARYASVAALRGIEQSRRDDLESLGFVWMYLLKGTLPWMGLTGRDPKQKHERICDVKSRTSFEELCHNVPAEFVRYFQAVRNLRFTECPNYNELKQLFRDLFIREGYTYDYRYDWSREPARPALPIITVPPVPPRQSPDAEPATQQVRRPTMTDSAAKPTHPDSPKPTSALIGARPAAERPREPVSAISRLRSNRRDTGRIGRGDTAVLSPRRPQPIMSNWVPRTETHRRFKPIFRS